LIYGHHKTRRDLTCFDELTVSPDERIQIPLHKKEKTRSLSFFFNVSSQLATLSDGKFCRKKVKFPGKKKSEGNNNKNEDEIRECVRWFSLYMVRAQGRERLFSI
jgi:hypothetical protein